MKRKKYVCYKCMRYTEDDNGYPYCKGGIIKGVICYSCWQKGNQNNGLWYEYVYHYLEEMSSLRMQGIID